MKHSILLTGSTGYLGVHLIAKLLRQSNVERILCTTRQKNPVSFWSSLESSSKQYELSMNESDLKSKIEPVEIDLVKDRNSLLKCLEPHKKTITVVHHLACEANYGVPLDFFKPWMDITEQFVEYCMDSKYPKQLHSTGSYGRHLVEFKHTDEDFYWINGYFGYKKWLHDYLSKKLAQGLKGVLFEPGYVVGRFDPGQSYMFWRVVRIFAALEYVCRFPMLLTPIEMLMDHYTLALSNPDPGPNVVCPYVPKVFDVPTFMKELLPAVKTVDFESFRESVKENLPKRAKYFGPNMINCMESVIKRHKPIFHPMYDSSNYENIDQTAYILSCKSFDEALKLAEKDKLGFKNIKQRQSN